MILLGEASGHFYREMLYIFYYIKRCIAFCKQLACTVWSLLQYKNLKTCVKTFVFTLPCSTQALSSHYNKYFILIFSRFSQNCKNTTFSRKYFHVFSNGSLKFGIGYLKKIILAMFSNYLSHHMSGVKEVSLCQHVCISHLPGFHDYLQCS